MRPLWLAAVWSALAVAADPTPAIRLDQAGYLPGAPKLAMVAADRAASAFFIRREPGGEVVYEGALGELAEDANSGDRVQLADFSGVREPGRYYIEIPEAGRSYPFDIAADVYLRAYYLAMRAFYGQRCGIAVDMGPGFPHRHDACHSQGAWHRSSGRQGDRPSGFGWHDAGDFGRYVVNSGISTGTLLWTWEMYGHRVARIALDIPESGNGVPDVLDEIRWNLEWMLSMQDDDGGVWPKQTSERFPDLMMPERDAWTSFVIGSGSAPYKSSCATGDFAAVMAIAQRAYAPFDAAFAQRAGEAAARAWTWLDANPNVTFSNPAGVVTGEYGDSRCEDERLWAAAELWRTTGGAPYQAYFLANYSRFTASLWAPGWQSVGPMALWTYALANRNDADASAVDGIRQASVLTANRLVDRIAANPYRISMSPDDFFWGSNSQAANFSLALLIADRLAPDRRYREAALENLHYLLGRNAFSVSWVTAVGSAWFMRPHHRPSAADGIDQPWPGMLSGGPNKYRNDSVLQRMAAGLPPMRVWSDDVGSYAGNEICINWNAPLVFVLAGALPDLPRRDIPSDIGPPGSGRRR